MFGFSRRDLLLLPSHNRVPQDQGPPAGWFRGIGTLLDRFLPSVLHLAISATGMFAGATALSGCARYAEEELDRFEIGTTDANGISLFAALLQRATNRDIQVEFKTTTFVSELNPTGDTRSGTRLVQWSGIVIDRTTNFRIEVYTPEGEPMDLDNRSEVENVLTDVPLTTGFSIVLLKVDTSRSA